MPYDGVKDVATTLTGGTKVDKNEAAKLKAGVSDRAQTRKKVSNG